MTYIHGWANGMDNKAIIITINLISVIISVIPVKSGTDQHPIYIALIAFVALMAYFSVMLVLDRMPLNQERYKGEGRMRFAVYYTMCGLVGSVVSAAITWIGILNEVFPFIILMIVVMSFGDYFVKVGR